MKNIGLYSFNGGYFKSVCEDTGGDEGCSMKLYLLRLPRANSVLDEAKDIIIVRAVKSKLINIDDGYINMVLPDNQGVCPPQYSPCILEGDSTDATKQICAISLDECPVTSISLVESDESCADLFLSPSQKCEQITTKTKLVFGKGSNLLPLTHFKVR